MCWISGTGLLSMMAARAMLSLDRGKEGLVSACESYLPMGKLMHKVLRANGMERIVKVFHKRSDELHVGADLDSHADVLVSEILDSELLGEGLIPTLQHAHDTLLAANPRTVPYKATTFAQLVESTFLWKLHDLYSYEVQTSDGIHLTPAGLERIIYVKPRQYAMHCDAISGEIRLLSEPFKVFEFDFWKRPDSYRETQIKIKTTAEGRIHALISWWVLQLDQEGSVYYSTAPKWISSSNSRNVSMNIHGVRNWCDHWKQCVWFVPGSGKPASTNDNILVKAAHDDISICYFLEDDRSRGFNNLPSHVCHLSLLPERIAAYGDKTYRSTLSKAAKNALQHARSSLFCVVADDSVFLTVLIASSSRSSIVISAFPGLQYKGANYLRAIADVNDFSMDQIKVFGKRASCLLTDDQTKTKVDLLMAEPFFYGTEGMLPWQNLRFWKERTILDQMLSKDVVIMPCRGILRTCAMSLPDLWRSRCCLRKIEGFDHLGVNETLGACGELPSSHEIPCLPYFIWQCGEIKELSQVFSIMDFDFSQPIHACHGKTKVTFSGTGLCHGFVLWIDWVLDEREPIVLSTGPVSRYWKQAVQLLSKPVAVNTGERSAEIEACFDPNTGEVTFNSFFFSSSS